MKDIQGLCSLEVTISDSYDRLADCWFVQDIDDVSLDVDEVLLYFLFLSILVTEYVSFLFPSIDPGLDKIYFRLFRG